MIYGLIGLGLVTAALTVAVVLLWGATGKWREDHGRVMKELLDERNHHLEERKAWAMAAAAERSQLLVAGADERAALVGALVDSRGGGQGYVVPPWPVEVEPRHTTENDEIEAAREAMVREVTAMAAERGVHLDDAVTDGYAS